VGRRPYGVAAPVGTKGVPPVGRRPGVGARRARSGGRIACGAAPRGRHAPGAQRRAYRMWGCAPTASRRPSGRRAYRWGGGASGSARAGRGVGASPVGHRLRDAAAPFTLADVSPVACAGVPQGGSPVGRCPGDAMGRDAPAFWVTDARCHTALRAYPA